MVQIKGGVTATIKTRIKFYTLSINKSTEEDISEKEKKGLCVSNIYFSRKARLKKKSIS